MIARAVSDRLGTNVKEASRSLNTIMLQNTSKDDKAELIIWLDSEGGGVLVTHDVQFKGYEVDDVIFITKQFMQWGTRYSGVRSGVTRAVAHLCIITFECKI